MDAPSTPLADYFWIAGIESISYQDAAPLPQPPPQVDETIDEDGEGGAAADTSTNSITRSKARHSRQNSANRLSKLSSDGRLSMHTLDERDGVTRSNRSSATIRAPLDIGTPDFDFDVALLKFAAERENFLDYLSFSAGAKVQARPPMVSPRAERIRVDDGDVGVKRSPLRSIKGSIRRKMSFRDMNSSRKQPLAPRAGKAPSSAHPRTPPSLPLYEC